MLLANGHSLDLADIPHRVEVAKEEHPPRAARELGAQVIAALTLREHPDVRAGLPQHVCECGAAPVDRSLVVAGRLERDERLEITPHPGQLRGAELQQLVHGPYNRGMRASLPLFGVLCLTTALAAQAVPQPFPKPGQPQPQAPAKPPATTPGQTAQPENSREAAEPSEGSLGVTIYPAAQFITSYDAGRGQRYYLYGTTASFAELVQYYRTLLRQRGELVFEEPPVHQFDLGRFREETMAFPPSVTVKDYTWGGSSGYLNPKRGAQPQRYPTIIQVVPNPPVVAK